MEPILEKVDTPNPNSKETDLPAFDYLNDTDKIDEELKCPICTNPYVPSHTHTNKK